MLIDIQSTVNVIIQKEIVKDICYTRGRFVLVHCNAGKMVIITEATLPGFVTVWFGNICIANILCLSKAKNK